MSNINEIDIRKLTDPVQSGYYNEEITAVNDHVIRVSVMTSGYPWHLHPNSDETFIVIEGILSSAFPQEYDRRRTIRRAAA
jgi:mannose-6-phosphate isomerase-like protein (cupin superfamily)